MAGFALVVNLDALAVMKKNEKAMLLQNDNNHSSSSKFLASNNQLTMLFHFNKFV